MNLASMNLDTVRLGWTLLHFVWQGFAIAVALALVLRLLNTASAQIRYGAACLALAAMVASPAITWVLLEPQPTGARLMLISNPDSRMVLSPPVPAAGFSLESVFPWIVAAWFAGVALLLLRLTGGWLLAFRQTRLSISAPPAWLERQAQEIAARLQLDRVFRLRISSQVTVPQVFGWLKPVVLIPAAALANLDPRQFEMILAHELAHIARRDFIVNLLQAITEAVLFYHPAVW